MSSHESSDESDIVDRLNNTTIDDESPNKNSSVYNSEIKDFFKKFMNDGSRKHNFFCKGEFGVFQPGINRYRVIHHR